jgi:hypothetical protein
MKTPSWWRIATGAFDKTDVATLDNRWDSLDDAIAELRDTIDELARLIEEDRNYD